MANFADPQENTNARKIVLATGNATDPAISSAKDLTKGIYFDQTGQPVLTGGGGGSSPNVVQFSDAVETDTTLATYSSTPSTVTISASSNTAKIKITVTGTGQNANNGDGNQSLFTIFKDGVTDLSGGTSLAFFRLQSATGASIFPVAMQILHTPGDTSPHTYTVYQRNSIGGETTAWGTSVSKQVIIAEEIH